MRKEDIRRPDEDALLRILSSNRGTIAEVILRLIWSMGLSADEVQSLAWASVSFDSREIALPDRAVPMDDAALACLRTRYDWQRGFQPAPDFVAVSDARRTHMHRVSIYRTARKALDHGGLTDVQLTDLRDDYIIRQLECHDWPYVVRVSGVAISTLYANYSPWFTNRPSPPRPAVPEVDDAALWSLILSEGPTPEGLALCMTWQLGMTLKEIAALTWPQLDLSAAVLTLPDRVLPLLEPLLGWLRELTASRPADADPHVLLTPRAARPFDDLRLSVVVRQALIRGGMEELSPRVLTRRGEQEEGDALLLRRAAQKGSIDRAEAMELLGVDKWPAYNRLRRLTEQGRLVRIGARYYPAGSVVPPEEHAAVICGYLRREGGAYRKEIADLLHVEVRSAEWILRNLQKEGVITKTGQRWILPEERSV